MPEVVWQASRIRTPGALNNVTFIWLVVLTILKNDGVRQWVSDDIPIYGK